MNSQVANCSCILKVFRKLSASEFTTSITTKYTYQRIPLDFSLVLLVLSKCLRLLPQEGNNLLMSMKILEECIVLLPPYGLD